jgi:hypothetical protein
MWAMSELNDMGCAEFADVAAELALGVLTGRERAEALKHLDHCETCRSRVRQLTMTGEKLLELLPSREPPAGFETRVMERLGLPVPEPARPGRAGTASRPGRRGRPGRSGRAGRSDRPATRRAASRPRRLLAAAAVAAGILVAVAGGWGLRNVTSPAASSPLSSAALLTVSHRAVGKIFYYDGDQQWVYMSVDAGSGAGTVICQLENAGGKFTTVGSFRLAGGYGSWASPAGAIHGTLTGARLVDANGTVLATATLPRGSA